MDRFSYIPLTSLTRFLFFIFCFSFFFFFLNLCFTLVTQNTSSSSTYNQHTVQLRSDFNTFVKRGRDVYLLTHVYGANALDDPWFAELTSWDFFFFFFAFLSQGRQGRQGHGELTAHVGNITFFLIFFLFVLFSFRTSSPTNIVRPPENSTERVLRDTIELPREALQSGQHPTMTRRQLDRQAEVRKKKK